MLSRVQITHFKSIGEGPDGAAGVDIALKPLTFLVGPNGGGKSSILEAIAIAAVGNVSSGSRACLPRGLKSGIPV